MRKSRNEKGKKAIKMINQQIEKDVVDKIMAQWHNEGYALDDLVVVETCGRLKRLEALLMKKLVHNFMQSGGLQQWEFDVLATLRRSGEPYCLSPSDLFAMTMVTSGTMTNRLHQLQKKNLVERLENPMDKRSLLVQLTKEGKQLIDKVVKAHFDYENELLKNMKSDELQQLNQTLKQMETYIT